MSRFARFQETNTSKIWADFAPVNELWLTFDLAFRGTSSPSDFGIEPIASIEKIGSFSMFDLEWFFGEWIDQLDSGLSSATPVPPVDPTFMNVEMHWKRGTALGGYTDGITAVYINSVNLWTDFDYYDLGADRITFGGINDVQPWYLDNVKIGTTRGGSQIFSDGFESFGFSAWTGTSASGMSVSTAFDSNTPPSTNVSVAFGNSALDENPSWIQIDTPTGIDVVSGFRIDRGRASEFDKTGTGTASIDLIDTEGFIDPTNPSGPFYGQIDPMKQVRIMLRNPVNDDTRYLFKGFASEWIYDVDVSGAFTKATLDCSDAFDLLSALEMTPGHHGDPPPENSLQDIFFAQGPPGTIGGAGPSRIHKALDDAGWPAGPREILPGNVLLQETLYARRDQLLSVIFDAADAEFPGVANVYISKSGYVTFHGRYARFDPTNPDYGIQFWKVGTGPIAAEDATIAPISGLRFRRSKSDIINAAQSIPQLPQLRGGGGEWTTAELATMLDLDTDSIAEYGWRSDSFDNLLTYKGRTSATSTSFPVRAVEETRLFSQWRVQNYKTPRTRVEQIVFRPKQPDHFSGPAIWALMTQVEIGDVVTLHTEHPGGGGFDNEDFFVEGIHYDAQPMGNVFPNITLTLDVSPRSLYDFNPFGGTQGFEAQQQTQRPAAIGPLSIIGGRIGGRGR